MVRAAAAFATGILALAGAAQAAEGPDGAALGLVWVAPFVGILLSIALVPLLAPRIWHRHFGKIALFWASAFAVPYGVVYGPGAAATSVWHTLALEYVPFIILLYTLFAVAGGILVRGDIRGTPASNTSILAFGAMVASLLGTTGAAMLLIRPLIRANIRRPRNTHVFVFFIFLVANVGGSLTPLGDPPLFLGFLNGVSFFWTAEHLFLPMLLSSVVLLGLFYAIDTLQTRREPPGLSANDDADEQPIEILGAHNVLLLFGVVGIVVASSLINPALGIELIGVHMPLDSLARSAGLIVIAAISLATTRNSVRIENAFNWDPIVEVALLFVAIFVTIIPALAILQAGDKGALAPLVALVNNPDGSHNPAMYFWLTGILSSFLDNAPTYLVFFNTAGGDAAALMSEAAPTLAAISAGAVFFGAITYIGNAPNFMVKTICEERGVRMPSFFGYMIWSCAILLPLFALNTVLFF